MLRRLQQKEAFLHRHERRYLQKTFIPLPFSISCRTKKEPCTSHSVIAVPQSHTSPDSLSLLRSQLPH